MLAWSTPPALVATGVNADGYREILGLHVTSAEDGAGWLAFFRDLTVRGLTGVRLVTSDAHRGLVDPGGAGIAHVVADLRGTGGASFGYITSNSVLIARTCWPNDSSRWSSATE